MSDFRDCESDRASATRFLNGKPAIDTGRLRRTMRFVHADP
jgi:hypothetical protein